MRHIFVTLAMLAWKATVILLVLSLYSCGAEGTSTMPSTVSAPAEHASFRLTDNKVPAGLNFANFKNARFSLDPSFLAFSGKRLFLKLQHQSGDLLYMGEIDRYRPFLITVVVRLDDTQLHYALFTNDDNDDTHFGVISLNESVDRYDILSSH